MTTDEAQKTDHMEEKYTDVEAPASSEPITLIHYLVTISERDDYFVDEDPGDSRSSADDEFDDDGEPIGDGVPASRQSKPTVERKIKSKEQEQREAREFIGAVDQHLSLCGFPHTEAGDRQMVRYRDELNVIGVYYFPVTIPILHSDFDDYGDVDPDSILGDLCFISDERFELSTDRIDSGEILALFAPATIMAKANYASEFAWLPRDGEAESDWLTRVVVHPAHLNQLAEQWENAGRHLDLFASLAPRKARIAKPERIEFLVPDLIPLGVITLLAGSSGTGKTTVLTELAVGVALGAEGGTWLGRPFNEASARGVVVYISGEDSPAFMATRVSILDSEGRSSRFIGLPGDNRALVDILADLKRFQTVSLLIVDPARKYLRGDENNSGAIDEFFSPLEQFASEKNAAVLVAHHLSKGAAPTSLGQFEKAMRGSQAWFDRPRQILGMFRSGDVVKIGAAKNSAPPPAAKMPETVFRFDPDTLRHEPTNAGPSSELVEQARVQDLVLAAVRRLNAEGRRLMRTGQHGLFEARTDELAGVSRANVWKATKRLIALGAITDTQDGLISVISGTA